MKKLGIFIKQLLETYVEQLEIYVHRVNHMLLVIQSIMVNIQKQFLELKALQLFLQEPVPFLQNHHYLLQYTQYEEILLQCKLLHQLRLELYKEVSLLELLISKLKQHVFLV